MHEEAPQRTARRRPHWISIAAAIAMLIPGVYCQLYGELYRNGESFYYGWPFLHPGNEYRFVSNAFWLDWVCVLIVAVAAGFVVESMIRARARFRLSALLLWTAIVPPIFGIFAYQDQHRSHPLPADFIDSRVIFDPVAIQYPLWIILALMFGLACLIYTTLVVAWRSFAAACRALRRSAPVQ